MQPFDYDPDGRRLPVKFDSTSNGEFEPRPVSEAVNHGNTLAEQWVAEHAGKLALPRRQFMMSVMGAATTLLAHNHAQAAAGARGGYFDVPAAAGLDASAADEALGKKEFILDVQGHFVNPTGAWLNNMPDSRRPLSGMPKAGCQLADADGARAYLHCLSGDEFIKDVFLDSDTDIMVLSFVPSPSDAEPLTIHEAAAVRDIVDGMQGNHRLLLHGRVNPNQPGDLALMDDLANKWGVAAWKCYTQYGPDGKGFYLDDDVGIEYIERARQLGVNNICIHKGLAFGPQSFEHSRCDDIGRVAKRFPDVNFLIYHSGYDRDTIEAEFAPGAGRNGIDSLVQSLLDNDVPRNSNVYAELGSTWRLLMQKPDEAAHALGKLFKYVGEDNVLWGTDSIWYGSPQDQIQAFRSFQVSSEFQDRYGYTPITPELRARVFGLNALKPYKLQLDDLQAKVAVDQVAGFQENYRNRPNPHYLTHGPKTRREFLNLMRWTGGRQA
jgi:predicted TIM-barrel fold metal-dependent hydrolase